MSHCNSSLPFKVHEQLAVWLGLVGWSYVVAAILIEGLVLYTSPWW